MTTLEEAIEPDSYEVAVAMPWTANRRRWFADKDEAVAQAVEWRSLSYPHIVVTAYGAKGRPRDRAFALRHFTLDDGVEHDSGWSAWVGGEHIGPVQ